MFGRTAKDKERASQIASQLIEAARIGSKLFSDKALEVLADGFSEEYGSYCLRAARIVCQAREDVPEPLFKAAIQAMSRGSDIACGLLAEYVSRHDPEPLLPFLPAILMIPDYRFFRWRTPEGFHERPEYPEAIELLRILFDKAPQAVQAAFDARLHIDDKDTKLCTAHILIALLPQTVDQILPLTTSLLRSLELDDNVYEASADGVICGLLAHLYAYAPAVVEEKIREYWPSASNEIKVLIFKMYAKLALQASGDGETSSVGFPRKMYEQQIAFVIDKLYLAVADLSLDVESRESISQELAYVLREHSIESINWLDRFIARLSMTIREAENMPPQNAGDFLTALQNDTRRMEYNSLINNVAKIVNQLIRADPICAWESIRKSLNELDSRIDGRFKAELVDTLAIFGKLYDLLPAVIPQLYKHLVDFESNHVRRAAINVLGDLLDEATDSIPDNMIDLLVVYLRDSYIVIHKSALSALKHYCFKKDERGLTALNSILVLEEIYFKQGDTNFLEEIVAVLYSAFKDWSRVRSFIITRLLPKYSQSTDEYFAEDMLVDLARHIREYSEVIPQFLQAALRFFKNTNRDCYNDDVYSDRVYILDTIFTLPSGVVAGEIELLREIMHAKIAHDRIEVIRLLEMLSHLGLHEEAAILASEALCLLPNVKANEQGRYLFRHIVAAEQAEALIMQGNSSQACATLDAT